MKPRKLVYGVGVNDADYVVRRMETIEYVDGKRKRRLVWQCTYYSVWTAMLRRSYSAKFQERHPTYKDCTVSEDWLTFSAFKAWMEKQNFEGLQLDKDLLFIGNKMYSSATCIFVTGVVNKFVTDCRAARGELLIGVSWDKENAKFQARCHNPFTKKLERLGRYTCEQQAHQAWLKRKNKLAQELAAIQTDPRVAEALLKRYSNH